MWTKAFMVLLMYSMNLTPFQKAHFFIQDTLTCDEKEYDHEPMGDGKKW